MVGGVKETDVVEILILAHCQCLDIVAGFHQGDAGIVGGRAGAAVGVIVKQQPDPLQGRGSDCFSGGQVRRGAGVGGVGGRGCGGLLRHQRGHGGRGLGKQDVLRHNGRDHGGVRGGGGLWRARGQDQEQQEGASDQQI